LKRGPTVVTILAPAHFKPPLEKKVALVESTNALAAAA
jgi:hypothetical protein